MSFICVVYVFASMSVDRQTFKEIFPFYLEGTVHIYGHQCKIQT